ncbi:type II toxin-antitoxin system RelE family toxin [Halocatena pleomorpha]|uniref:Type II toxin-antitoxin system RelE/ParE family toxin n=1 Tax=Halocatena pleomorpha TaxID=1785090 RepID=A0A3P3R7W6_9EURY|nr:type II toxin-antitoxin system RelE/ParE family toxin [Halocatena pleomorpha]RRJ28643.1 type II toxin-antitoxin system RelE/ParE family toxin [Halocatena pleomorpha]
MTRVDISLTAREQLNDLSTAAQQRIKTKLLNEVSDDPERYLRPLSNSPHQSIRVGDYRVIVDYDGDSDRIKIHDVGHRRNIYD